MAGTIVNAVYLDLRLNMKGVEKGLNNLSGRFEGLSINFGRLFNADAANPMLAAFDALAGRTLAATRNFAENADAGERVRGVFGSLAGGAADVGTNVAEMGRGLANAGFFAAVDGANRLLGGLNNLSTGVRCFGTDFRTAFSGARRESDSLATTLGRVTGNLTNNWQGFTAGLADGWQNAWQGIGQKFNGVVNRIITGFNGMIGGINRISIDIPVWLGGGRLGFNIPQIPSIPALARGGIVSAPTLALVGEAGKEAVLPLENNTGWMVQLANMLADAVAGAGRVGASTHHTKLVLTLDGKKLAEALLDDLHAAAARRGRL
ncbi:MAG: hypothetical protein FWE21_10290 [Defluviitaleaceae bacterium]|nr:hypothetical protein [Defluviitaleaceae bacterium]